MATPAIECVTATVADTDAGSRLDAWLARQIPELSRARLQKLLADGQVTTGGAVVKEARRKVKAGEVFEVAVPEAAPTTVQGEDINLTVVYEDRDVIVIDKPAGLVVHPAAGHASGTLVNALINHCGASLSGVGGVKRPGIVHRLDKDTTGLLVVAKNDAAHQSLSDQFKVHGLDGRLHRAYLALVWGTLTRPKGAIDVPLARSTANRTKIAVSRNARARHAVTHYEVLKVFTSTLGTATVSMVRLVLETGRTHQIRVHLAHIGHPVLGDPVYGAGFKTRTGAFEAYVRDAVEALGRQALHAESLGFEHPVSGDALRFESPLPADISRIIDALEGPPAGKAASKVRRTVATGLGKPKRSSSGGAK